MQIKWYPKKFLRAEHPTVNDFKIIYERNNFYPGLKWILLVDAIKYTTFWF